MSTLRRGREMRIKNSPSALEAPNQDYNKPAPA
jgi:hypothetical protein